MPGRRRLPIPARWTAAIGASVVVVALAVIVTAWIAGRGPSCGSPAWGQLQGDAAHDGQAQGTAGTLSVRWTRAGKASGGLVLAGGDLLVGQQGGVAALSTGDGVERWHWSTADQKGNNIGPPAVSGCAVGVVESRPDQPTSGVHGILHVVSTSTHELVGKGLDIPSASAGGLLSTGSRFELVGGRLESGTVRWGLYAITSDEARTSSLASIAAFTPGPPAADGDTSFVSVWDSSVQAVTSAGRQLWRTATTALPLTPPVVSGGKVMIGTIGGADAFDSGSGRVLWTTSIPSGVVAAPLPAGDGVLVLDRSFHKLHRLDLATGRELWAVQLGTTLAPPVLLGTRVITADEQGEMLVLDSATGKLLQKLTLKSGVRSPLAVGGGSVYAVGNDGRITAIALGG
ncbi:MAG TPA: PQQ-binding-like beta-propeller repeat protein [Candidatus Dormibacteraeota bacterium]|nr:PQQ-binding-like beta-propeller repeat protein [Candidatus Dormibacteraeota bacterium]